MLASVCVWRSKIEPKSTLRQLRIEAMTQNALRLIDISWNRE